MWRKIHTCIDRTEPFKPVDIDLWFEDEQLFYMEVTNKTSTFFLKPISSLEELTKEEADKIRENQQLKPYEAIDYLTLYKDKFYTVYLLHQIPIEEPKEDVFELLSETFKPEKE
jgi:hypothetical protein